MKAKFETIIESYLNGNISWVRTEIKKLSKENRKALYLYISTILSYPTALPFFFSLI